MNGLNVADYNTWTVNLAVNFLAAERQTKIHWIAQFWILDKIKHTN